MHEATSPRLESELLKLVYEIKADVSSIKQRQEEDHDRLFGNGQPGELATLENKINAHSEWITRADEREKTNRKWTAAISTGCSAVIGAAAGWIAKHFGA